MSKCRIVIVLIVAALCAAPAVAATSRPTVLVLPLRQLDQTAGIGWLGRAVQQSLEVALPRSAGVWTQEPAADGDVDALVAAKNIGAALVLTGSYQVVGDDVRLTCALLDGKDGTMLAGWNTDGKANELLKLEDDCADRAARAVRGALRADDANATDAAAKPMTRDEAAATLPMFGTPKLAPAPKPVAGQADPRPYGDRTELARYHYFYQYPTCGYFGYGGYFGWGWGYGNRGWCGCGGPQATVGFYSQGSN